MEPVRTFLLRMAESCRVILINTRGTGLSDRPRGVTIESRMADILAVSDAVGSERFALLGMADGAATCAVFAASYPERVDRLILHMPVAGGTATADFPWAPTREAWLEQLRRDRDRWGEREYLEDMGRAINPQWADDQDYLNWFVWNQRMAVSPGGAAEFRRIQMETDIADVLPSIRLPTLILTKQRSREQCVFVAERIPGAQLVMLPGVGGAIHENDEGVKEIESFLRGEATLAVPDSVLATLLFTDLVGSTERAALVGDRAWRDLLARHHSVVRRELARFRGEERDTAGDGFFATFDGPARAIRCAHAIIDGVTRLGIELRAGVHTGECELHEQKVTGIAVSIGARVAGAAQAGEVLVSSTVKDLVAGSGIEFEERGEHELKGVPGSWSLFAAR
jgi:class 3 adenylate cyclase